MITPANFRNGAAAGPASARVAAFAACERGNVIGLFVLLLIPILGAAGVAIDYGRAVAAETSLQAAVDSAVLASRSGGLTNETAIKAKAAAFFATNSHQMHGATIKAVDVTVIDNVIDMQVHAAMPTTLSVVLGRDQLDIRVKAKAAAATEDVEIALVLDNTGSMRDFMDDLKTGAKNLVEAVHKTSTSTSKLKIAVVPYVGAVNIGNGPVQMGWMDVAGDADRHAANLEGWSFGYEEGCSYSGGGSSSGPGTGATGSLFDLMPKFAQAIRNVLGISTAQAASASDVHSPFQFYDPCWIANPNRVNLFDLINKIPNAQWKGCVIARPEPYDVEDTPPTTVDPNSLFVPWFWPDQPDAAEIAADGGVWASANDYLPDRNDLIPNPFSGGWNGWTHWSILKYNNTNAAIDEIGPDSRGPNKSCPDPILPLTTDKLDVIAAIDRMVHWNGSGTNVAEGLAWGWRVLSPEAPFTEGAPYGKNRKVLVLMTDGVNNIDPSVDDGVYSDFSAYGYLTSGLINPPTYDQFRKYTDERMVAACQNAKIAGLTIYTVAFGIVDQPTLAKLEACASKPPYAYAPGTASELVEAFGSIGASLTELRLME
ncbi:MAG: TadE/TadG family type IV pilus assembly protein [Hyphomicrobium sp.]